MKNNIIKYFCGFLAIMLIDGCNETSETQKSTYVSNTQSSNPTSPVPYTQTQTTPAYVETTFAQDIESYDILSLEESEASATQSIKRAPLQGDVMVAADDAQTSLMAMSDSSSDEENTTTQITQELDYRILGASTVTLNEKEYHFSIAQDILAHRVQQPTVEKEGDHYLLTITCYFIEDDELLLENGLFTLQIRVPSLSESGYYQVTSNVLTNSADTEVYAYVSMVQRDTLIFHAQVDDFYVYNRDRTKMYLSNFSLDFELR